ncbi:NADPH-dependent F420 reductase, partial [Liquorilactobacillus sp.]|uniref:NADPH-dependent F420 reductase n=1 Tax=Liquorilactobacillus sp. TaxID=2767923 RepID=UPI0039E76135
MNIGFIGSGHVGQALASLFAQAGHSIVLSNRHGVTSLQDVIARLGNSNIKAGTIEDAAAQEIVVLAFPFNTLSQVQPKLLEGKLVIDATNYFPKRDGDLPEFIDHKIATSQYVANYFTG